MLYILFANTLDEDNRSIDRASILRSDGWILILKRLAMIILANIIYDFINIIACTIGIKNSKIGDHADMKKKADSGGLCIVYLKAIRKLRQMKSLKSSIK